MRILVVSNLYPPDVIGGYELLCRQAADALVARGHDVRVLTTAPRTPAPTEPHVERSLRLTDIYSDEVNEHSKLAAIRLMDSKAFRISAFNVHQLFRSVEEFQPDVVYLWNLIGLGGLGILAALKHRCIPWVWHLEDHVPLTLCRVNSGGPNRLVQEVARQLRGFFISCSTRLVREIEGGGLPLGPTVEVIPNWGVTGDRLPMGPPYEPGSTLRLISAGRLSDDKGIGILIETARLLKERGEGRFVLDLFGKGQDLAYQTLIRRYSLEQEVRLCGPLLQKDLLHRLADYHVFGFPTWDREPFGLVPLEAASRGCVPIMSFECGVAEWLVDGVHCLKAERTPAAYADRIQQIIEGRIDLSTIARRAWAAVWRDFHVDAILPRIESLLEQASRQSRAGAGTVEEFYRLAVVAERLAYVMVQDDCAA